jgi:RNase P protein component
MTSGVKIEPVEAQQLASFHLINERGSRFSQGLVFGVAEVYKVAVVRKDLKRLITEFFTVFPEGAYAGF